MNLVHLLLTHGPAPDWDVWTREPASARGPIRLPEPTVWLIVEKFTELTDFHLAENHDPFLS